MSNLFDPSEIATIHCSDIETCLRNIKIAKRHKRKMEKEMKENEDDDDDYFEIEISYCDGYIDSYGDRLKELKINYDVENDLNIIELH